MSGLEFYVIDLETTGLSVQKHEVCEASIVRVSDRVQLTQFIKCEHPHTANFDALAICNKTMADLEKGSSKEEAIEKIDNFLNEDGLTPAHRCFIAHNYTFDKRFLHSLYDKVNKICPANLWTCTMALTKQYAKNAGIIKPKVNLHAALDLCQVKKLSEAHASKSDSRNTYLLWKNLVEEKKVDYLPFIKTAAHVSASRPDDENEALDPDLLDL